MSCKSSLAESRLHKFIRDSVLRRFIRDSLLAELAPKSRLQKFVTKSPIAEAESLAWEHLLGTEEAFFAKLVAAERLLKSLVGESFAEFLAPEPVAEPLIWKTLPKLLIRKTELSFPEFLVGESLSELFTAESLTGFLVGETLPKFLTAESSLAELLAATFTSLRRLLRPGL